MFYLTLEITVGENALNYYQHTDYIIYFRLRNLTMCLYVIMKSRSLEEMSLNAIYVVTFPLRGTGIASESRASAYSVRCRSLRSEGQGSDRVL